MPGSDTPTGNENTIERLQDIQQRYEAELMSRPHVVGVAIGIKQTRGQVTNELALIVMVDEKIPTAQLSEEEQIPSEIEGMPVDVQQTGAFYAQ
ncbi:MAG: hypothetical protein V2J12_04565 [Gammaproteobacteria bacterium]|jgi:hypothetical protein|nr:hypothetical protein [Gammaproteobacteria bacterium]